MDDNAQQNRPPSPRRRLGRGLTALLGSGKSAETNSTTESSSDRVDSEIAIDQLEPNPFQPRKDFDSVSLAELADSIRRFGVLQPLLVRPANGRFQIIAGERRWRAAREAGLTTVPCRRMELEDQAINDVALEENLKRKDLGVLEKAEAFYVYIERFHSSPEALAKRLSMSRSAIVNFLRLLELPESIKKSLRNEKISNGHARALLPLEDEDRLALCKRIEKDSLSVRKTEQAVKEIQKARADELTGAGDVLPLSVLQADMLTADEDPAVLTVHDDNALTPHVASLQEQLRHALGVKVEIQVKGKDAGKIIIPFQSTAEFENLLRQLRRAA